MRSKQLHVGSPIKRLGGWNALRNRDDETRSAKRIRSRDEITNRALIASVKHQGSSSGAESPDESQTSHRSATFESAVQTSRSLARNSGASSDGSTQRNSEPRSSASRTRFFAGSLVCVASRPGRFIFPLVLISQLPHAMATTITIGTRLRIRRRTPELSGGGPVSNKSTEALSRRPLE